VTVDTGDWLTDGFEAHRAHLRAVAYRMLGSTSEADDAVQEAWLRLSRSDVGRVQNLGGWLTTSSAGSAWTCSVHGPRGVKRRSTSARVT
jgi:Sigma-70 region 2